jgi:hypothetical protein
MTYYQFNSLNEKEQAEAMCEHGILVGSRRDGEYKHFLFQIHGFYLELQVHTEQEVIEAGRVFSNTDHLQPYLEQMMIRL